MAESERGGLGAPDGFHLAFHIALGLVCHPWGWERDWLRRRGEGARGVSCCSLLFSPSGKDQIRQELR